MGDDMDQEFLNILEANEKAKAKVLKSKNLYEDYEKQLKEESEKIRLKKKQQLEEESSVLYKSYQDDCAHLEASLQGDIDALQEAMKEHYEAIKEASLQEAFKELVRK